MFNTILVATDGSEAAGRALETGIDLALKYKTKLWIVHVHLHGRPVEELERMAGIEHIVPEISVHATPSGVPAGTLIGQMLLEAEHEDHVVSEIGDLLLHRARDHAQEAGVTQVQTISATGDYADAILDAVDDTAAELLVMGRRGLGRVRQLLLGSVSNKVVQQSGAAVLLMQ